MVVVILPPNVRGLNGGGWQVVLVLVLPALDLMTCLVGLVALVVMVTSLPGVLVPLDDVVMVWSLSAS